MVSRVKLWSFLNVLATSGSLDFVVFDLVVLLCIEEDSPVSLDPKFLEKLGLKLDFGIFKSFIVPYFFSCSRGDVKGLEEVVDSSETLLLILISRLPFKIPFPCFVRFSSKRKKLPSNSSLVDIGSSLKLVFSRTCVRGGRRDSITSDEENVSIFLPMLEDGDLDALDVFFFRFDFVALRWELIVDERSRLPLSAIDMAEFKYCFSESLLKAI
mmetsp:Transcript_33612/g.38286  ORF Transcript_33612/g.38286 Transcript_33612/m.38286 type:complete len:213 (-) Transcript_33612:71-709(-)